MALLMRENSGTSVPNMILYSCAAILQIAARQKDVMAPACEPTSARARWQDVLCETDIFCSYNQTAPSIFSFSSQNHILSPTLHSSAPALPPLLLSPSVGVAQFSTWQPDRKTCTELSLGLLTSRDKGLCRSGDRECRWIQSGCCPEHPATHSGMERSWSWQDVWKSTAILPSSHLGSVWIFRGLTMSAREKGILTKDSVSLLPCFYFVEVGLSDCMLLTQSRSQFIR